MVTARHPGRLRRSVTAAHVNHSWDFLCGRVNSPWLAPANLRTPVPTTLAWEKQPAASTSEIVTKNLTDFWAAFNPDLELRTSFRRTTLGLKNYDGGQHHGEPTTGTTRTPIRMMTPRAKTLTRTMTLRRRLQTYLLHHLKTLCQVFR